MIRNGMTTYVLGAGASLHAGYPFVKDMGSKLLQWMKARDGYPLLPFRDTAKALEEQFGDVSNIETLLNNIESKISRRSAGYSLFANCYKPALMQALRECFAEIHQQNRATAYKLLAERMIQSGDCIITFNYDVSLDRELKQTNLWTLGDGYGFRVQGFEPHSPVTILKLHGSIGWLAAIFNGLTSGPVALGSDGAFGSRPIFSDADLSALGYENCIDPAFPRAGTAAIPPLILPTNRKKFYFDTSLGPEWKQFWDSLWKCAKKSLKRSDRVVICGYGMFPIDRRGCNLLLNGQLTADVEVCCGHDSNGIVQQLQSHGRQAHLASEVYFERWVETQASAI